MSTERVALTRSSSVKSFFTIQTTSTIPALVINPLTSVTIPPPPTLRNPPPPISLAWLWTCHICRRSYAIGVTRRCLEDGHYLCSGVTENKALSRKAGRKIVRQHRPCSSEFDYGAWKEYGNWRRQAHVGGQIRRTPQRWHQVRHLQYQISRP